MGAAGVLFIWLVLGLAGAVVTVRWSRRMWGRRNELALHIKIVAVVVAASALFAALGTIFGLVKAFGALGEKSVDPSQKARMLAMGISEAMNCTALGLVVWVPSVIALAFVTRRRRDRSQ